MIIRIPGAAKKRLDVMWKSLNRLVGILQRICLVEVVAFKAGLRHSFFLVFASLLTTFNV